MNNWNDKQKAWFECWKGASKKSVEDLYDLIGKTLDEEDELPEGQRRCHVRQYPDFKEQADVFAEIIRQNGGTPKTLNW